MSAPIIAQLILAFGPAAINLIQKLTELWQKPALTVEEVNQILSTIPAKTYQQYLDEAKAGK